MLGLGEGCRHQGQDGAALGSSPGWERTGRVLRGCFAPWPPVTHHPSTANTGGGPREVTPPCPSCTSRPVPLNFTPAQLPGSQQGQLVGRRPLSPCSPTGAGQDEELQRPGCRAKGPVPTSVTHS